MVRRLTLAVLALLALVALAVPTAGHVELEPGEGLASSIATLTFSFHHGLHPTATVGRDARTIEATTVDVPNVEPWANSVADAGVVSSADGPVSDGAAAAPDSSTGGPVSVAEAGVVSSADGPVSDGAAAAPDSSTGGPVSGGAEASFPLVVELPATIGVALVRAIQISEDGRELAWMPEAEGTVEAEHSNRAPRLALVADPDAAPTGGSEAARTASATATTNDLPRTVLDAESRDDGGGSLAPWVIGSGLAALVMIAVGGTLLKRRMG